MRLSIGIVFSFFFVWAQAQIPLVGSGRQVYRPDQVDSLFYWFDAQDATTITTTNNKVTAWADKGPFGYDVVQADTSKAPTYSATSGPGGSTAAMVFDGTNDFLASAAHFWGSDDLTVFVVMKFGDVTRNASETIVAKWLSTTPHRQWIMYGLPSTSYRLQFNISSDGATNSTWFSIANTKHANYVLHVFNSDGSDGDWFRDGSEVTATDDNVTTIYNSSTEGVSIGAVNTSTTPVLFLQGSISEIIVFSRALTNAERQGIEAYLSSKYDLALENKQKPPVISNRRIQPDYIDSLFYWFDANDASTITTNNNKVTQWDDKGPFGYDVMQADTSKAPTYSATAGPGGTTAALQFDGSNDFLASAAHWWGSDDYTIFTVHKFANATRNADEIIIGRFEASGNKRQFVYYYGASPNYAALNYWSSDGTLFIQDAAISLKKSTSFSCNAVVGTSEGSATLFYQDGVNFSVSGSSGVGGESVLDDSTYGISIGAVNTYSTPALFLQGSISEIIVFSRALSDSERVGVEQYLKQKWGL